MALGENRHEPSEPPKGKGRCYMNIQGKDDDER